MSDRLELRFAGRTVMIEPGQSAKMSRHAAIDYRGGWHVAATFFKLRARER